MSKKNANAMPTRLSEGASAHLDMIRGLAALAVFIGHARTFYFLDAASVPGLSAVGKLAYYLTGFGHQSVMIFFVLSGFLVGGSVLRGFESRRWSWSSYLSQRATRLYIVLIPALMLTAIWDSAGVASFGLRNTIYGGNAHGAAFVALNIHDTLSLRALLGNLGFLQTIRFPCFGTNSPLWSLANEGWYYLIFPLLVYAVSSWKKALVRVVCAAAGVGILAFLPRPFLEGFVVWLLGALIAFLMSRAVRLPGPAWLWRLMTGGLLVAALHLARLGKGIPVATFVSNDLALGITFALFLWTIVCQPVRVTPGIYTHGARVLSGMSYTLYVVHFPMLAFLQGLVITGQRWTPNGSTVGKATLIIAVVAGYAYLISRFTEARTDRARAWLVKMLRKPSVASPSEL